MGLTYRTDEELQRWLKRDPIKLCEARLIEQGVTSAKKVEQIHEKVREEIKAAVAFAESSPLPDPATLLDDVYCVAS